MITRARLVRMWLTVVAAITLGALKAQAATIEYAPSFESLSFYGDGACPSSNRSFHGVVPST